MRGRRTRTAMRLTGTVSSGLGRAHVFMAQEHYQNQFKAILGDNAWPGTLNVQVSGDDLASYVALRNISGVDTLDIKEETRSSSEQIDLDEVETFRVRGFLREGRSFGGATAFHATMYQENKEEVQCAILIPYLTRHVDVVEVIATAFLRECLELEDGDEVTLKLS